MKSLNYLICLIFIFITSCTESNTYTITIRNRSPKTLNSVKLYWGANHNELGYGHIYENSGKTVGLVLKPKGKIVLRYNIEGDKIEKELNIMSKIPKDQSGEIILYIRKNGVVELKFIQD